VILFNPRANKPNRRGMVMRGQGIPAHLARPERAAMRHPTQNPGLGMKSFQSFKNCHEKNLGRAVSRARVTES